MAKNTAKPLNVFIGCPGDMAPERDALLTLEKKLARHGCPVKFLIWPDVPPSAGRPQQVIFDYFPVSSWDIFIGILWMRFGSPAGEYDDKTGKPMTGTEEEFKAAYRAWKDSGGRRPHVAIYRCERVGSTKGKGKQIAAVDEFFEQLSADPDYLALAGKFETTEEFKEQVERHLEEIVIKIHAENNAVRVANKKPGGKSSPKPKPANSSELLHRYFANLRDQFAIYENLGLPVPERDSKEGEKDVPLPIRKLFVEPACTEGYFRPDAFDAALREGKNPATPLLPRLAPAKSRTVLLADPGMGKSTLIQWLISTLADEAVPPGAAELRGAIPLPFILRDLVTHLPHDVQGWNWDALVDAFRQWRHRGKGAPLAAPLTADDALFRSTLASPDAFFLIDGLDEIGDPQRRLAIRDAIWEGFEKYPDARWLITSRIVGYEQAALELRFSFAKGDPNKRGLVWSKESSRTLPSQIQINQQGSKKNVSCAAWREMLWKQESGEVSNYAKVLAELGFERAKGVRLATLLHLAPFDDAQQLTFARNWYIPRLGDSAGTQRADDFIAAVHRNDHTRVISRVPNLLYLLALLFRHRARLPDGRALVYAAISSAYLADIDLGRHLPDSLIVPWKFEEKEDLLALVAMRMQEIRVAQAKKAEEEDGNANDTRGEILVTRAQLEQWLGPRFTNSQGAVDCDTLHSFLDHIANRSGLLLPRGEGVFGFAHLSFQEYYAACALEKEFQRILTDKSQTAGADIFGSPSSAAEKDEEKMFADMAALPAWHEPLLFLVEKLRHSAPYTRTILGWTFPQLSNKPPSAKEADALDAVRKWMPFTAAQLLAGISLDQEVNLDDIQRATIWRSLWQARIVLFDGKSFYADWNIAPFLLVAGSAYHNAVLDVAATLKPSRFHLFECAAVSDLKPLSSMSCLNILWLFDCTALSDLKPLAGLRSLNSLSLAGCTAVSDLTPLETLRSLRELHLDPYTGMDEMKVRALKEKLPKLKICGPFGGIKS